MIKNAQQIGQNGLSLESGLGLAPAFPSGVRLYEQHAGALDALFKTAKGQEAFSYISKLIASDLNSREFCDRLVSMMDRKDSPLKPETLVPYESRRELRMGNIHLQDLRLHIVKEAVRETLDRVFSAPAVNDDLFSSTERRKEFSAVQKITELVGEGAGKFRKEFATAVVAAFAEVVSSPSFQMPTPLTAAQERFLSSLFDVYPAKGESRSPKGMEYLIEEVLKDCQYTAICHRRFARGVSDAVLLDTQPLDAAEKRSLRNIKSLEQLHEAMVLTSFDGLSVGNTWSERFTSPAFAADISRIFTNDEAWRVVHRCYSGSHRPDASERYWPSLFVS